MSLKPTPNTNSSSRGATIFSVTSGKSGVGKTSLAVNLGVEFAHRGYRTIIVDVDLGLANTNAIAGVQPSKTLSDYLDDKGDLVDLVTPGPGGVKLISSGNCVQKMAGLDDESRHRIVDAVLELRPLFDVIILDTSAGIARPVSDFIAVSDHTVVVTTPDFSAIADAYGTVKTAVQEQYASAMHLLVNRVRSPEEGEQVYRKLKDCAHRFLGFDLNWLGFVPEDTLVESAVIERKSFCEAFPDSVVTRYVRRVVASLERLMPATSAPPA